MAEANVMVLMMMGWAPTRRDWKGLGGLVEASFLKGQHGIYRNKRQTDIHKESYLFPFVDSKGLIVSVKVEVK